jgi:hypothetical protein
MPNSSLYINQIDLDQEFYAWASGQDVRRFNGSIWEYYDSTNSAVPQVSPYYLDTRCISIDPEDKAWVGVAQGPTAGNASINQIAVFWINTNKIDEGDSWTFQALGTFNQPQEVSLIYACPFGDDILAFINPLNGVGGTGASDYTRINGATGGRLFYYLKETDQWDETVDDYTWPHIYDIETKGYDGKDYLYYMGTSEGLFVVPQGKLQTITLTNGSKYIQQAKVYNTSTSGIISDNVYCLDFDENGNLWIGTDIGISYFDGVEFWNYGVSGGPITCVKARDNGHVFYSMGDGELGDGTGLWHFNGTSHTQFNTSNSSLGSNAVLGIELIGHNTNQDGLLIHANDLWILGYNSLKLFNYDLPHVYGSSKYAGATGWNFTYHTATGGGSPLPKVNKYTWTYPEWMVYDSSFLEYKHPGLDPRNLFLTTKLSDIADGRAGKQPYWNNWALPSFEQDQISESIQASEWEKSISYISGASGNIGMFRVTSSATQTFLGEKKYYVGGYIQPDIYTGNYSIQFGYYADNTPAILSDYGPSLNSGTLSTNNSVNNGKTGFIVSYSERGNVESILPFKGFSTEVQSLCSSEDGLYLYASGTFNRFIEVGEFVWGAYGRPITTGGATGAPVGITNPNVPGATAGTYPGIGVPSFGTVVINSPWSVSVGSGDSVANTYCDFGFTGFPAGTGGSYDNVNLVYLSFINGIGGNEFSSINNRLTGQSLIIVQGGNTAYYRIDQIYRDTNSFGIRTTYQSGATAAFPYTNGTSITIQVGQWTPSVYPYTIANGGSKTDSNAAYVVKIGRDLGSSSTFTDINGVTGDYESNIRKKYRINSFRYFPPVSTVALPYPGGTVSTKIDSSRYHVNLAITHTSNTPVIFSSLKNEWDRTGDISTVPYYIGDLASNEFGAYIKLDSDNLDLVEIKSTSGSTGGFSIEDIKSSNNENGFIITGQSSDTFNMMGLNILHPSPSASKNYPFYIISGPTANGITGGIVDIGGTSSYNDIKKIITAKDNSGYYVNTIMGDYGQGVTGTYFGSQIVLGSTGQNYLYTAEITDQGTLRDISYNSTGVLDRDMGFLAFDKINESQFFTSYQINTPGLTGYSVALLKTNNANKNLDLQNLGTFEGDLTFSKDTSSNVFIFGVNTSGSTGGTGSFVSFGSTGGFSTLSEQYYPELGINLGNIISRPGSGAWTWCDVHSTDNYMEIPLLSTVVFNNYASNIYGKKNNKWILSNSETKDELLNIKGSPYFIYTFVDPGYYTIYNQVEDSAGNIYEVSKPGFIKVIDHKDKRPDDTRPDFVDSSDYGYPNPPFLARDYQAMRLGKDLMYHEMEILQANKGQFGSAIVIPNNPDSTFNKE